MGNVNANEGRSDVEDVKKEQGIYNPKGFFNVEWAGKEKTKEAMRDVPEKHIPVTLTMGNSEKMTPRPTKGETEVPRDTRGQKNMKEQTPTGAGAQLKREVKSPTSAQEKVELKKPTNTKGKMEVQNPINTKGKMPMILMKNEEDTEDNSGGGGDEEGDTEDPQVILKKDCGENENCKQLFELLEECNERVNSKEMTKETCEQELYDFVECVDACVAKDLFKHLK